LENNFHLSIDVFPIISNENELSFNLFFAVFALVFEFCVWFDLNLFWSRNSELANFSPFYMVFSHTWCEKVMILAYPLLLSVFLHPMFANSFVLGRSLFLKQNNADFRSFFNFLFCFVFTTTFIDFCLYIVSLFLLLVLM
jgi:hypothetical protein